jgi:hypothetical protein
MMSFEEGESLKRRESHNKYGTDALTRSSTDEASAGLTKLDGLKPSSFKTLEWNF